VLEEKALKGSPESQKGSTSKMETQQRSSSKNRIKKKILRKEEMMDSSKK
jgi:hypothetical protein